MQEISMHAYGVEVDNQRMGYLLDDAGTIQSRLVWFHLSSLLSHAAMISKIVSPISRNAVATDRSNAIKAAIGIAGDSEVLPRNARDNTEHFDERMDNWVSADANEILEIVLPNRNGYNYLGRAETRIRRVLLKEEYVFVSENRDGSKFELDLHPLLDEIRRIGVESQRWIRDKSPYAFIYPRAGG
jgi:hypothetical protein